MISRRQLLKFGACAPALSLSRPLDGLFRTNPVSSGDPELDRLIGGGYTRGRITQVLGDAVGVWLLPMYSTEVALQNGQRVVWVSQQKQMVDVFAETAGYDIDGVQLRLAEDLESALRATAEAARQSDLVVAFASLAELPSESQEPPCRQMRRLNRTVRRTETAVVIVTDGGETDCERTSVGRAIRFYAATRVWLDLDYFGEEIQYEVVKNKVGGYCT
jgi:hypothetical protein